MHTKTTNRGTAGFPSKISALVLSSKTDFSLPTKSTQTLDKELTNEDRKKNSSLLFLMHTEKMKSFHLRYDVAVISYDIMKVIFGLRPVSSRKLRVGFHDFFFPVTKLTEQMPSPIPCSTPHIAAHYSPCCVHVICWWVNQCLNDLS